MWAEIRGRPALIHDLLVDRLKRLGHHHDLRPDKELGYERRGADPVPLAMSEYNPPTPQAMVR